MIMSYEARQPNNQYQTWPLDGVGCRLQRATISSFWAFYLVIVYTSNVFINNIEIDKEDKIYLALEFLKYFKVYLICISIESIL